MNAILTRARLYALAGAVLVFFGGLLLAIGHWNNAETDRAFVEAAARAARMQARQAGLRYWTPEPGQAPTTAFRARLDAEQRLRRMPTALPTVPQQPPSPDVKTPAAPR